MHQPHQFVNAGGHERPLCLGVPDVPVGGLSSHLAAHLEAPLPFGRDRLAVPEGLQRFDADEVTSLRVARFGESGEDPRDLVVLVFVWACRLQDGWFGWAERAA